MQIHFYDQWDKQSSEKSTPRSQKDQKSPLRWMEKLQSMDGSHKNIVLIILAVITAFVFSYLVFSGEQGQAVINDREETIARPNDMLYTVRKGDTLWTIAGQHYPELTREEAVVKIQQKNGFQGTTIHAGQTILLP